MSKGERLESEISIKDSATKNIEKIIKSNERLKNEMLRLKASMDKVRTTANKRMDFKLETNQAKQKLKSLGDSIDRVKEKTSTAIGHFKTLGTVAGTALAVGIAGALKSGADLEKNKVSMEHFIGVQNKGMSKKQVKQTSNKYLNDLRTNANATPFETGEVVQAGVRALGVSGGNTKDSMKLLKVAQDMAALTPGKTLSDAMEALADAKTGEMERLKEFGFKVSAEKFKGYVGKGKNDNLTAKETDKAFGTLTNQKLSPFFKGGAQKLSQTSAGKASTIAGNVKSGIQDAGYNMLKGIKPETMDKMVKVSANLGKTLGTLGAKMVNTFSKVAPHIKTIASALASVTAGVVAFRIAFAGLTIMKTVITLFKAWRAGTLLATAAQLGLNLAMLASPFTWIAIAIGAVIAIGVLLYLNWDKVKKKASELWSVMKEKFASIKTSVMNALQPVIDFFGRLMDKWSAFKSSISNFKMPSIGLPKWMGGNGLIQKKAIGGVIPRDNYPALLHEGERVLTKQEVKQANSGNKSGSILITGNTFNVRSDDDITSIADQLYQKLKGDRENFGGAV